VDRAPSELRREQLADVGALLRHERSATVPSATSAVEPHRLYTYEEIGRFCGVPGRRVRRWVEDGKMDYTPLPGGRGRRISGQQYLDYIRQSAVAAEV
jgi:excisionase family DNA binding protein